jgi:hypothetical protein
VAQVQVNDLPVNRCIHYWSLHSLLVAAFITGRCIHYWSLHSLLVAASVTGRCIHYWSLHPLQVCCIRYRSLYQKNGEYLPDAALSLHSVLLTETTPLPRLLPVAAL